MKKVRTLMLLFACIAILPLCAQDEDTEYRMELGGALGLTSGLNDANSKVFGNSQLAGGVLARFLLNPRMAIKTSLTYGKVKANTAGVDHFYPANPEMPGADRLQFAASGGLYDLSALYELNFLPYGYYRGYQGFHRLVPYIQLGVGFAYSDAGDAFCLSLPLGVGLKYKIGRRLNLGLEWRMHLTACDKLEGLEAPLGLSSGGFRNKDHYSFTMFTLTYDLSPRCPTCNKD